MARLYEARNASLRKGFVLEQKKKKKNATIKDHVQTPFFPVKRLTPAELKEKQEKGLCFKCNKKFRLGHHCPKLFMIEACNEEDDDGDIEMEIEGREMGTFNDAPGISLHAIAGIRAPETKRVKGKIGNIGAVVLIDSGSSHNFISEKLAKTVGLQTICGGRFEKMVALGDKLKMSTSSTRLARYSYLC